MKDIGKKAKETEEEKYKEIQSVSLQRYLYVISATAIVLYLIFFTLITYINNSVNLYVLTIYLILTLIFSLSIFISRKYTSYNALNITSFLCITSALIGITLIYVSLGSLDRLLAGIFIILIAAVQLSTGYKFILAAATSVLIFPNFALLPHDIPLEFKLILNVYLLTGAILYATVSASRVKRLKQVAKLEMAFAEQQEQTERLARVDALTGLWNRRHFFELAKREIYRAGRQGTPPGILLILDIDHFKSINDTFGHAAGDELLKHLGRTWTAILRESDILGRIGGEEFAVLLPATGMQEGQEVAERLRQATEMETVVYNDSSFSVTLSLGGASIQQDETIDQSLNRADRLLYRAKEAGRNCVELEAAPSVSQG